MKPFDDAAQILFGKPADELDETEREVLLHSREGRILSQDRNVAYQSRQSAGERIADGIARVGGSWAFIIGFLVFEPHGLAAIWARVRRVFHLWPFKT